MSETEAKLKRLPFKWDFSILIAMIAVLISTLSAYISFKESKIMMEQQKLALRQQEASVWPYLENTTQNNYMNNTEGLFTYLIVNKGVGPAIIDDVKYKFDGKEISPWGLFKELQEKYSHIADITQKESSNLNKAVLAPGESYIVITEKIVIKSNSDISAMNILNEIGDLYILEYCYCSVYGKCWEVKGMDYLVQSEKCEFRREIR